MPEGTKDDLVAVYIARNAYIRVKPEISSLQAPFARSPATLFL